MDQLEFTLDSERASDPDAQIDVDVFDVRITKHYKARARVGCTMKGSVVIFKMGCFLCKVAWHDMVFVCACRAASAFHCTS